MSFFYSDNPRSMNKTWESVSVYFIFRHRSNGGHVHEHVLAIRLPANSAADQICMGADVRTRVKPLLGEVTNRCDDVLRQQRRLIGETDQITDQRN